MEERPTIEMLERNAAEMRKHLLRLCHRAGSLHIGGDLSMADLVTALFQYGLRIDPRRPRWEGRDRFVLSKGHGAGALYVGLAMAGFFDVTELFERYDTLDSPFGIHPTAGVPGVEIATGSLGHGLSICVGIALAARLNGASHRVFTLMGDGEIQEGSVWEAAMAAKQYRLGNLVAIVDRNGLSLDGETEQLMGLEPLSDKWQAFGWRTCTIDGHDMSQIVQMLDGLPPSGSTTPTAVIARTTKGKGVSFMENDVNWHAGSIDAGLLERCCHEIDDRLEAKRGA